MVLSRQKMKILGIGVFLLFGLLLAACSSPTETAPPPTVNVDEIVNATLTAVAGQATATPLPPEPTAEPTQSPPTETPTVPEPVEGDPAVILGEPDGQDPFDNANNWSKFNNDCFANDIDDGELVMDAKGMRGIACWTFTWPELSDFYMETEVINPEQCQPGDSFGMIFRAPDNYRGYLFGLSCEGRIGLLNWDGQLATTIIDWTGDDRINLGPGARNRIGVSVFGGDFQLFANGHFIAAGQNFDYQAAGRLGYYVFASTQEGFTVRYDNLKIWLLGDQFYPPSAIVPTPPPNPVPPPGSDVPTATTVTYVNVRSGPGLNFPIYFVAPPAMAFEVFGVSPDGSWWGVLVSQDIVDSGEAWVSGDYVVVSNTDGVPVIQPPEPPPGVTPPQPPTTEVPTATALEPINVRAGPSATFDSYGVAPIGATAEIIGVSADGGWWVIKMPTDIAQDGQGWVKAEYIKAENAENVPVIEPPV